MCHYTIAQITLVVICHPGIDVARFCTEFPIFAEMIPRKDSTESLLTLTIVEVGGAAVIDCKHRQFTIGVDVPRI